MLRRRLFAYTCAMIAGISSGYYIFEQKRLICGTLLLISIAVSLCFVVPKKDIARFIICLTAGFLIFARAYISYEMPVILPDGTLIHANDTAAIEAVSNVSGRVRSCIRKDDTYRIVIDKTGIKGIRRIQITIDSENVFPGDFRSAGKYGTNETAVTNKMAGAKETDVDLSSDGIDENLYGLVGKRIEAYGKMREFRSRENPACFDYRLYMRGQGVRYSFKSDSLDVCSDLSTGEAGHEIVSEKMSEKLQGKLSNKLSKCFWGFRRFILGERERFLERFEDDDIRGFIRGMIFGDKSEIDEDVAESFNNNSTGHILAVSGLHIGFLYALLRWLSGRKRTKGMALLTIAVIILYGEMTLWSASTIRAVIVLSINLLAVHLRRRSDLLTSVSAAAMLILFFEPYQLFSTGFQMTFLALVSICFIAGPLSLFTGEGLAVMFAVQIGIAPLTAYAFNRFNPLAVLINVPVLMIASLLIPACIFLVFVSAVTGYVPGFCVSLIRDAVGGLISLNEWLSFGGEYSFLTSGLHSFISDVTAGFANALQSGNTDVSAVISEKISDILCSASAVISGCGTAMIISFYLIVFLISSEWMRVLLIRKDTAAIRCIVLCMLLPAVMLCAVSYNDFADDEIIFVSVGQGDCTHIRCGSEDMLIDGGGNTFYNVGEKTLMPYLLKNGAADVDIACVTHLHTDHFLGLSQLEAVYPVKTTGIPSDYRTAIENERAQVKKNPAGTDTVTDDSGDKNRDGGGLPENITFIEPASRISLGRDVYIVPIWPAPGVRRNISPDDANENNMVYMIHYNGIRIMVTGDLTEEDELEMVKRYSRSDELKCDILKVAHHGSKTSSSEVFLDAANPDIAVISVGQNNLYGHPHAEILQRLEERGIQIYRTDLSGAVGIDIRNGRVSKTDTVID